jgi:predicted RNase H-like nuclease (RuvC/YqgF family)
MSDYNFWQMKGYADNRVGAATRKLVEKIDRLEEQMKELKKQLKDKNAIIEKLRSEIAERDAHKRKQ